MPLLNFVDFSSPCRWQRIFSFVDWYVDNCRHEMEEEGVSDEYLNIRAKFLQLIPDTFSVSFYSRLVDDSMICSQGEDKERKR